MATYNRLESLIEKPSQNESSVMQSMPIDVVVSSFEEAVEDSNEITAENTNALTQLIDRIEIFTRAQEQNNANMPPDMAALLKSNGNNSSPSGTVINDSNNRNEREQEKKNKDEMDSLLKKDIDEKKTERRKKDIDREEGKIFRKEVTDKFTDVALAGTAVLVGIPVLFKHLEDLRGHLLPHIDTLVDTVKMGFDPSNPNNMATRLGDFLNVKVSEIGNRLSQNDNLVLKGLGNALYGATGGSLKDTSSQIQELKDLKGNVSKYMAMGQDTLALSALESFENSEAQGLLGNQPMTLYKIDEMAGSMYDTVMNNKLPSEIIKEKANAAITLRNRGDKRAFRNARQDLIKMLGNDAKAINTVDMLLSGSWTDFENMYEVSKEAMEGGRYDEAIEAWNVFGEKDRENLPVGFSSLLSGEDLGDSFSQMLKDGRITKDQYINFMNKYLQSAVNNQFFEPYEEINRMLGERGISEISTAEYEQMRHKQEGKEWSKEREHYLLKDMLRRGTMSTAEWAGVPEETKQALESQGYGPYISRIGDNWRSQTYEASVGVTQSLNKLANDAIGAGINVQELEKYSPSLAGWIQSMGIQSLPEYILNEIKQRTSEEGKPVMITNNISQSAPPVGSATTPR